MPIPPSTRTRLEKMANDNGFDLPVEDQGDWLLIHSSRVPLRMWLSVRGGSVYLAALSQLHVARALSEHGNELTNPIPKGACAVRTVSDLLSLHRLVRRAFQLSSTLPDELLHTFLRKTESLPRQTEVERLVVQRIGQDVFRQGLLDCWEGRCAITGLAIPELLRSSHIKPWADCETDAERLDIWNGFLLAPHLDAAFDRGFVTVRSDGSIEVSPSVSAEDRARLGIDKPLRIAKLSDPHKPYLTWHWERVFRGG